MYGVYSLAPNFFAHSSLPWLVPIANTLLHPFALAPWRMDSPTQPTPKTATLEFSTSGVLVNAPYPVVIPHPKRHAFSSGALWLMATTENFETTVYCEKVEQPIYHELQTLEMTTVPTHKVENFLSFALESNSSIRHGTFTLSCTNYDQPESSRKQVE